MIKKRGHREAKINVNKYIRENIKKGHSINSLKKWLIEYGYDDIFVSKIISSYRKKQLVKNISLGTLIVVFTLFLFSFTIFDNNITSAVVVTQDTGCCIDNAGFCHNSLSESYCNTKNFMYINHDCFDLPYCKERTVS